MFSFALKIALLFSSQNTLLFFLIPQYLVHSGLEVHQIAYLFGLSKLVKIFSTMPFGYIFDKKPKQTFLLSILFKFIAIISLFFVEKWKTISIIISTIFIGLSQGSIFIKTDVFVYNFLKEKNKIELFPRYLSLYYLLADIIYTISMFSSGIILQKTNYNIIFMVTLLNIAISALCLYLIPNYKIEKTAVSMKNFFQIIKGRRELIYLLISFSIINGFVWQMPKLLGIILQTYNKNPVWTTNILSFLHIGMILGCLISMIKIIKRIKNIIITILILISILMMATFFLKSIVLVITSVFLLNLFYLLIEISIERKIDDKLPQDKRAIFFSSSIIIMTIFQMVSFFIFGKFLEWKVNPILSIGSTLFPVFLFFLIIFLRKKFA